MRMTELLRLCRQQLRVGLVVDDLSVVLVRLEAFCVPASSASLPVEGPEELEVQGALEVQEVPLEVLLVVLDLLQVVPR